MKTFVTIFPNYRNIHFRKDPGQIPFRLKKLNYKTRLVTYDNEKLDAESVTNLEIKIIPKGYWSRNFNLGMLWFIFRSRRSIDILHLFHLEFQTLLMAYFYKLRNKNGFVYLKMDNCHYSGYYPWEDLWQSQNLLKTKRTFKQRVKDNLVRKILINKVDLFTIEDNGSKDYFNGQYPFFKNNLKTSFNGHTVDMEATIKIKSFSEKENIIITAGSLGIYQKATEILVEAFVKVAEETNWELHLAGPITELFKEFLNNFFLKYPYLQSRITIHGLLTRRELFNLYNRAKIFCLPSRYEGFANVFSESMYFKNAIITTPYVAVRDIIVENKCGLLVEKEDVGGLSLSLSKLINDPGMNEEFGKNGHAFAIKYLNWDKIVEELSLKLPDNK